MHRREHLKECLNHIEARCFKTPRSTLQRLTAIAFSLSSLLLQACSTGAPTSPLFTRLENRGPVSLSTENPFIASNLFVSQQAERSSVIRGFLKYRGAPAAIEINNSFMKRAEVLYYYPESREFYSLESDAGTWIVSGPDRIPPQSMLVVSQLTRDLNGSPILRVTEHPELIVADNDPYVDHPNDKRLASAKQSMLGSDPVERELDLPQGQYPAARQANVFKSTPDDTVSKASKRSQKGATSNSQAFTNSAAQEISEKQLNTALDQLQKASGEQAELSPKGDLVHYVTFSGETLSIISRWYTHDRANAGRIARINDLNSPDNLQIGDVVVIPRYLLRNRLRLSEPALKQLQAIAYSDTRHTNVTKAKK